MTKSIPCAFVIALVLAACGDTAGDGASDGGGGGGGGTPGGGGAAQTCVDEINRYRAMNGKPAYKRWTSTESCADGQAESDSKSNKAHGAFGDCKEFGQDECPGWGGTPDKVIVDCLKAMWDEGPGGGHHDIMNSDKYTQVACGFFTTSSGKVWAVQDFK